MHVIDSDCDPPGDLCTGIVREHGRIKFVLSNMASNFERFYKICVKLPGVPRQCKAFQLVRKPDGTYGSKIDFVRAFASHPDGRYAVTWFWGDGQLSPPLHFSKG